MPMLLKTKTISEPLLKAKYKNQVTDLRLQLLQLQFKIRTQSHPVIVVIAGDDRTGRHDVINELSQWMDARFIRTNAYGTSDKLDEQKPFFWRYWRDLPAAGQVGIYVREWTSTTIVQYLNGDISDKKLKRRTKNIRDFEKMLADDGALMLKFWLHLSKDAHRARLNDTKKTPLFDPKDKLTLKNYKKSVAVFEQMLRGTHRDHAPWHIVNGEDPLQRNIEVGQIIAQEMQQWLEREKPIAQNIEPLLPAEATHHLDRIDLTAKLKKSDYEEALERCSLKLYELVKQAHEQGQAIVAVFEGVDAAGKGGAIRRIASALDVGLYRIVPIAKPSDEDNAHHYLWRFWKQVPANGLMTIFDRSWYGRVLVERVEKFASESEWQRSYDEINHFEEQLDSHGIIVLKFWLHIDQAEQLQRFKAREQTPHKLHKITEEDYRNREKWPQYDGAIHDMLEKTSTSYAPWHVIPARDKRYARIAVFEAFIGALEKRLTKAKKKK